MFVRPELSRRVGVGGRCFDFAQHERGVVVLRLGVWRGILFDPVPAEVGVQLGTVLTGVALRYFGFPIWAPAFAGVRAQV